MTATPPANWYPDPSGVGELRYWDGTAWTPGVVVGGQVAERPMPWPPVASASAAAPDDRPQLPGRAALYGLAGFVAGLLGGLGLALAGEAAGLPDIGVLLLNLAGLWSGLLAACWRASRRFGTGNLRRDFGLEIGPKDVGWGLLMSLGARLAGAIAIIPFLFGSRRLIGNNQGVYGKVTANVGTFLIFAVIAVVGAPIVEELFFRGLLLRSLTTVLGPGKAIVAQAVLFGLAHFSPLLGLTNLSVVTIITAAGVVFGVTAWWRRRVGTSIVAHSAFNLISVIAAAFYLF
jgi:membrane protease YdiL (CAAX protease family)